MSRNNLQAPHRRISLVLTAAVAGLLLASCTSPAPPPQAPTAPPATSTPPAPTTPTTPPPPPPLAWGPEVEDARAGLERAREMSDDELASLVIVPRYEGTGTDVPAGLVADDGFGGVILFGPNVASLEQVRAVGAATQDAARARGWDWPAIMAVDNEGGTVQRLTSANGPWTTFPAFAAAGEADPEVVRDAMEAMGRELRASGFNTNYAPVADITAPGDAAIGTRAASDDPDEVSRAVGAAVEGFTRAGVLSSVKHFPGHGGLAVDSHVSLPVQPAAPDDLETREFEPFAAGIEAGVPMVMVGHIAVADWGEGVPASLNPKAYAHLREQLDFSGVTITDGLDMGALPGTPAEIAVAAMGAGADILLTPGDAHEAKAGLLEALEGGDLTRDRLEEAAGRIITMMRHQRHLAEESGTVGDEDIGAALDAARALAGE